MGFLDSSKHLSYKEAMNTRISLTLVEIKKKLEVHVGLLQKACTAYDEGNEDEIINISTRLGVLLHDGGRSRSRLGQLEMLNMNFLDSSFPADKCSNMPHGGLVLIKSDSTGIGYIAGLDEVPYGEWVSFDKWWNANIFVDTQSLPAGSW